VASTSEPLREATAEVFESWIAAAGARFVAAGIPRARARELAVTLLAVLEGAFILSRATRSTKPVEIAGVAAAEAVRNTLATSMPKSTPSPRARRART
jgi:hypothetical protein